MIDGKYYEKESIDIMLDNLDKKDKDLMKIIKMFLIGFVLCVLTSIIALTVSWHIYLYAPVVSDNSINGDSNTSLSNNTLDNTDIDVVP